MKNQSKVKQIINKDVGLNPRLKKKPLRKLKIVVLLVIILAAAAYGGWKGYLFFNSYRAMQKQIKDLSIQAPDLKSVVDKVSKHIVLPKDEEPVFATITDIDALKKDQPFYEGSENGQQVLVYKKAKIVIVYDPQRDIIVKIGPVFFNEEASADSQNPNTSSSPN